MTAKRPTKKPPAKKAGAVPAGWGFTIEPPADEREPKPSEVIDWPCLLARARELDRPLSDEDLDLWKRGKIDGNARMWNADYVHAMQQAIKGKDPSHLFAMMGAEIPIPAFLLPLMHLVQPKVKTGGRPPALTVLQDSVIRDAFDRMTTHFGVKPQEAQKRLAAIRGVSKKTIERSLQRTGD